ncbi:dTDP-4-amino-4,6-dideoxy-D-glucose ammonia-lyase [Streptomyces chartreusis]|uniref:dTDP-4-amino-4,6-dideoxy-D-glucose ammonia-lyase n=1 Tax=Streptomyces chartreusis TaxID=1969 RepID=UPI0033BEAE8E
MPLSTAPSRPSAADREVENCARPDGDPRAAAAAVRARLAVLPEAAARDDAGTARHLVELARAYGSDPFLPLERMRGRLGVDRPEFARLLGLFRSVPQLGAAVARGPAGQYWANTILPYERSGAWSAALAGRPDFPRTVGLYPGPTCMFRCHFCVRVTGARYPHERLAQGNALLSEVIEEMPTDDPGAVYLSGGLEPLTNPGLGELVRQAARRGLRLTLYTNAFALSEQTLRRQPGLWDLHAMRVSLYGLDESEYTRTTTRAGAFERVTANLLRFQRLRRERREPVLLGLNYIVLPGRSHRLRDLAAYVARLNEAAPERPVDFLTLREDYSGRPDGLLPSDERARLRDHLAEFEERIRVSAPTLRVDHGYALHAERMGADGRLVRVPHGDMRPTAHPQLAVQVDLLGDVYLYREAGFPGLAGADRYIAGRVRPGVGLGEVVRRFVTEGRRIEPRPGDEYFLDGFDQVATARLRQLEADTADGWSAERGFLR